MKSSSLPWISVVIPIKDERDNIPLLTSGLLKFLENREETLQVPFEILYVDDGSTDGSGPLLDSLAQQHQEVQVVHMEKNYGQTAAFDAGFRQVRGELVATLDGDLQYDPTDIAKLLPLVDRYDLVCGRRQKTAR